MDSVARLSNLLLSMNSNCRPLLTSCRPLLTSCRPLLTSCRPLLTSCRPLLTSCRPLLTSFNGLSKNFNLVNIFGCFGSQRLRGQYIESADTNFNFCRPLADFKGTGRQKKVFGFTFISNKRSPETKRQKQRVCVVVD